MKNCSGHHSLYAACFGTYVLPDEVNDWPPVYKNKALTDHPPRNFQSLTQLHTHSHSHVPRNFNQAIALTGTIVWLPPDSPISKRLVKKNPVPSTSKLFLYLLIVLCVCVRERDEEWVGKKDI